MYEELLRLHLVIKNINKLPFKLFRSNLETTHLYSNREWKILNIKLAYFYFYLGYTAD